MERMKNIQFAKRMYYGEFVENRRAERLKKSELNQ